MTTFVGFINKQEETCHINKEIIPKTKQKLMDAYWQLYVANNPEKLP